MPALESRIYERLGLDARERAAYVEIHDRWAASDRDGGHHQVLGHAAPIQNEMQLQCQLVSSGIWCGSAIGFQHPRRAELEPGADEWRLLLQLDSDGSAGMEWGDSGRLYFWIRAGDLKAGRFEDCWMVLQCY